jgi:hypothetical protein
LNWIAGDEMSFFMSAPHFEQCEYGGSLKRWMTSTRSLQLVHSYSYSGMVAITLLGACRFLNPLSAGGHPSFGFGLG